MKSINVKTRYIGTVIPGGLTKSITGNVMLHAQKAIVISACERQHVERMFVMRIIVVSDAFYRKRSIRRSATGVPSMRSKAK